MTTKNPKRPHETVEIRPFPASTMTGTRCSGIWPDVLISVVLSD